jgi:DNA-binding transcriptional LysR family regulator
MSWPSLQALELFVAVVDESSVSAGARKVGMAQPNASRVMAGLEIAAGRALIDRTSRGSAPTPAGLLLADRARDVLDSALRFNDLLTEAEDSQPDELRVGASMTIAECLLPAWLARMRRRTPALQVDLHVLNSTQVLDGVRDGTLQLGLVETPRLPLGLNATVVREDELVVVVAPDHPWARRRSKVTRAELAQTALVVRERGSGTREALDELLANLTPIVPAQVLGSNAAVRVAVASGQAPAALSKLAVDTQLATGELLQVPLETRISRPLTAVWPGPRRLTGHAAQLVETARDSST